MPKKRETTRGKDKKKPGAGKRTPKDLTPKGQEKVSGGYAIPIPGPYGPDNQAPYTSHARRRR